MRVSLNKQYIHKVGCDTSVGIATQQWKDGWSGVESQ